MTKLAFILLLLLPIALISLSYEISIEHPSFYRNENGMATLTEEGAPMVPYLPIRILLPQGHEFKNIIISFSSIDNTLSDIQIEHARRPLPISADPGLEIKPDPGIYTVDKDYPYTDYSILQTGRRRGYDILHINLYPFKYNPVQSTLSWPDYAHLEIETEFNSELFDKQNLFLVEDHSTRRSIAGMVINPEIISSYHKTNTRFNSVLPEPDNPYQMIIITSESLADSFDDYIAFKESENIPTTLFTVQNIYQNYSGYDNQNKIRNFIIDAYQTYAQTDTPLDYILIGGDDTVVPYRGMFGQVHSYVDNTMPSDIYYSNLDGDWDANNNGIYGEINDGIDWYAEVSIGRIATSSPSHINNFINKNIAYVTTENFTNKIAYMYGENLNYNPLTWGGDYKDEIIPLLPSEYHIQTLYERDGTFSADAVSSSINEGLGIINHIGHANYNYVFGLNNLRVQNLTNTDYGFAYTQGCYPAAFDQATSGHFGGSVGQNLVNFGGGLFAFIGNTRYGWYMPGSTNGPSQAYDITFFEALFDHDILEIGDAFIDSREQLVNQAMSSGVMRWIFYQLILFGDPSVTIKDPYLDYPYIIPGEIVYDDFGGDQDGAVNPGETVGIYIELQNLDGWSDAEYVEASISFANDDIEVINADIEYGYLHANSSSVPSEPFTVYFPEFISYGKHYYTLSILATSQGGAEYIRDFDLYVDLTLSHTNWPWNYSTPIHISPLVHDLNNNNEMEIIVTDVLSNTYFLTENAEEYFEPFMFNQNLRAHSSLYLDPDGNHHILIANRRGKLISLDPLNDSNLLIENDSQFLTNPAVADINGDGENNIVISDLTRSLYVLNHNGNNLPGFPVQLGQNSISNPAIGDINNDGFKEIVIITINGLAYAFNYQGEILPGFPVNLNSQVHSSPVILDNGNIVVGTNDNRLLVISPDAEILVEKNLNGRIVGEPIVADFNNNGAYELAFNTHNGFIYLTDQSGISLPNWPYSTGENIQYAPLAADINNDGFVNLISATNITRVFAFGYDAEILYYFPVPLSSPITSPIVLADIDSDGTYEIMYANVSGLQAIDLKTQKGEKAPWTTFRGNYLRTGNILDSDELDATHETEAIIPTYLAQNYPNPFNPETNISFYLEKDSLVELDIYNLRGQKIYALVSDDLKQGQHSYIWSGKNYNNRPVASGIYFYSLKTGVTVQTRKMILLK